jgi:hypothetical protein
MGDSSLFDAAEGLGELIVAIILWVIATIVILILLWFLSSVVWSMLLLFAAALYWIFFRALRLVFKRSAKCKGQFLLSVIYAISYTALYVCWIYGIIFAGHYLV